ncbi:MAG TPA: cytochrome c oxidase assembly protein [Ktedonobacteraceae bacterium]
MLDGLSLTWSWNPGVVIFLLLLCLLYLWGLWQARRRRLEEQPISAHRIAAFFGGIVIVALFVLSPINTIARTQLLSVHFAQIVILASICAPLVLYGCPAILLRPLVEVPVVRDIMRFLTFPLVASLIFNGTFLLWHAPKLYNASLADASLYQTMVLGVFCASLLNWWPLIGSLTELRKISYPIQIFYAFFDGQPVDIFALVLVFSGVPFYPHYALPPQLGLSRFADQAVGGAFLLVPGLIDLAVMSPLFFRWLAQIEAKTRLADQRRQQEMEAEDEYEEEEQGMAMVNEVEVKRGI